MLDVFLKTLSFLSLKERLFLCLLMLLMGIGALMELAGLGLVMPVVAMFTNPGLIEQNKYLRLIHTVIAPSSNERFILVLCAGISALYLFKNLFLTGLTMLQAKFVYGKAAEFGVTLFNNYIMAPYKFFLGKNSSEILNNINLVGNVAGGVLMPGMMLATECFVIAAITAMLLALTPGATLIAAGLSLTIIGALYFPFRNLNSSLGEKNLKSSLAVFRVIMQAFEGIKDCKLRNCEDYFASFHAARQRDMRAAQRQQYLCGQLPRFFIEVFVVFAGMAVVAVFVALGTAAGSMALKFSLMALALLRLMPSFSRVQYYMATIRQNAPMFNAVFEDITKLRPAPRVKPGAKPVTLDSAIRAESLSFSYDRGPEIIKDFSLEIPRHSSVAFVGPTGCGKTTLLDIILGLLKPSSGRVTADGRDIEGNLPSWQTKIGYVPQTIFLMDDSIKMNVAFGLLEKDIDETKVRKCLETAQLLEFADGLPDGINTVIGERGVRLSGGQRQRIGIARALYHDPEILALDEATSALDNDTEKAFVDALRELKGKLTIIMIAHRLTTVQNCDKIIKLEPPA
jgi:ABC-type multidrug transport system fused ATPase/permease subunit